MYGLRMMFSLLLLLIIPLAASAQSTYQVTIDTSNVNGLAGKLAFDFTSPNAASNTINILNFSTDGTQGLPETAGALVNGDIILGLNPAPFTTMVDASFGNNFFFTQLVVVFESFGDEITFTVVLTENGTGAGGIPDQLAVFLLHETDLPLIGSSDPLATHALFAVTVTGAGGGEVSTFTPAVLTGTAFEVVVPSLVSLLAAILPTSRSVLVGVPATAFVAIINPSGTIDIFDAAPFLKSLLSAGFQFAATDPSTNAVIGSTNIPADILADPSGSSLQTFVIAITPTAETPSTDVLFNFLGANGASPTAITGVNTLLFSASATPIPDIVALAATLDSDGIVKLSSTGVFAVATVNVGASGTIIASADTGGATLPVTVKICETNPATGVCINPTAPATDPVTTTINANATPTFGIFVDGTADVPFDPANSRIFVRFKDNGGVTRGSTSVAVTTQAP